MFQQTGACPTPVRTVGRVAATTTAPSVPVQMDMGEITVRKVGSSHIRVDYHYELHPPHTHTHARPNTHTQLHVHRHTHTYSRKYNKIERIFWY
jgi:hypothetical protein